METGIITSSKNEKIKRAAALQKSKKERNGSGLFAAEGLRIARDVFRSAPELVDSVIVSESFINGDSWKRYPELGALGADAPGRGFDITVAADGVFAGMCETITPQGIMCIVRQPSYSLGHDIMRQGELRLLILEDIQDPGNLGTMVRTAEAAGMNGMIMSRGCADIFSPKVTRSTMGAIFRLPFIYTDDLCLTLGELKKEGVEVYAACLEGGVSYRTVEFSSRCAFMIGNEGNGLSPEAIENASHRVFIPMAGEVESLNAAVAAAILMYA